MIVGEIHHGKECIVYAFFQPCLSILIYCFVSIPSMRTVSLRVGIFPYRRTADLYPRFECLYFRIDSAYDAGDVIPSPLFQVLSFSIFAESGIVRKLLGAFRIADIIEMDAVNVVSGYNFPYQASKVIGSARLSGIQIPAIVYRAEDTSLRLSSYPIVSLVGCYLPVWSQSMHEVPCLFYDIQLLQIPAGHSPDSVLHVR